MKFSVMPSNVDVAAPLIYMWQIHDTGGVLIGRYIGKANGGDKRPTRHYARNVERYLEGKPYRNGKHYRRVHLALAAAVRSGHAISLSYLCNVGEDQDIFEVERQHIREYRSDAQDGIGLNGPLAAHRQAVRSEAPPALPTPASDAVSRPDLDDFLEVVEEHFPGLFEARPGSGRYSLYLGRERILRAKQARPGGAIQVKQVQSSRNGVDKKFSWDGLDAAIIEAIDTELALFRARPPSA